MLELEEINESWESTHVNKKRKIAAFGRNFTINRV
jgi:hypothetical protein